MYVPGISCRECSFRTYNTSKQEYHCDHPQIKGSIISDYIIAVGEILDNCPLQPNEVDIATLYESIGQGAKIYGSNATIQN